MSWKNPNSSTARKDGARRKLICPRSSYCRDILLSPPFIVCHLLAHERTLPPFIPFPVVTPHTPRAAAAPATVTWCVAVTAPQQQRCDKCAATLWISSIKRANWRHPSSCSFLHFDVSQSIPSCRSCLLCRHVESVRSLSQPPSNSLRVSVVQDPQVARQDFILTSSTAEVTTDLMSPLYVLSGKKKIPCWNLLHEVIPCGSIQYVATGACLPHEVARRAWNPCCAFTFRVWISSHYLLGAKMDFVTTNPNETTSNPIRFFCRIRSESHFWLMQCGLIKMNLSSPIELIWFDCQKKV